MKYSFSIPQQSSLPHGTTVSSVAKSKDEENVRLNGKEKKPTVTEWHIWDLPHLPVQPILLVAAAVAFNAF